MPIPTSFNRFFELPLEIQSQIWRYAATRRGILEPDGFVLCVMQQLSTTLKQNFFYTIYSYQHFTRLWLPRTHQGDRSHALAIARARKVMMATSSAARRITLQMWKKDVESSHIGPSPLPTRRNATRKEEEARGIKRQAILLLDELIE